MSIAIGPFFESMHCQHWKWASSIDLSLICMNIFVSLCHVWSPWVIINHQPSRISLSTDNQREHRFGMIWSWCLDSNIMANIHMFGCQIPIRTLQMVFLSVHCRCWWVSDSCLAVRSTVLLMKSPWNSVKQLNCHPYLDEENIHEVYRPILG